MARLECTSFNSKSMDLLHLIIIINVFSFAMSVCPAGWAQYENRCYYIFEEKLNKDDAVTRCSDHAAQLVSWANESGWKYISSLMKDVQLNSGAWTALTFNNAAWTWPESNYTELHHWRSSQDVANSPNSSFVPQPDSLHAQAQIVIVGSETYLMVQLATTQLYPFCVRDIDARDVCDSSWTNLLHECYKLYPPATWSDAISACSNLGGDVYIPGGPEEFIPADSLTDDKVNIWVGASYKFMHQLSNPQNSGYYYEADNYPVFFLPWLNQTSNYSDPNITCMAAQSTFEGLGFYMDSCVKELPFICRRSVGTCPLGWYQDGTQCFQLHIRPKERVTWFMAVDYCRSHNAEIAQDLSKDANTVLYNLLIENEVNLAWLGFSGSDGFYRDMHGAKIWGNYYLFDTTISSGGPASCGVTDFDPRRNGLSLASYCYTPQPFVCSIALTDNPLSTVVVNTKCDDGWIPFYDYCYQIIMSPMTYNNAVENCQSLGASVFHVNSTMEQSFFSTPPFMMYGLEEYWIGVKYVNSTNYFIFPETGEQAHFWNLDPPYNSSYGACLYVNAGSNSQFIGSWSADNCNATHNFVCQKPAQQSPTQEPIISPTFWSSQCGIGWTYSNITNLCYFISPYVHKLWQEAREDCQSQHGDLISIDGEEEQFAIESLLKLDLYSNLEESLWIGAGDLTEDNGWGWSNGRPFHYLHWAEGEPQYASDDGDNCGYIPVTKFYEWETRSCGDKLGFICRKSVSTTQTGQPPTLTPPLSCKPQPLISGEHSILFDQDFSASSYKDSQHTPEQCRLTPFNYAAWSPANNSIGEWLAVTFHSPVTIASIQIKGEDSSDNFVSQFKLQYQYDDLSPWYWYTDNNRSVMIFDGVTVPDGSASVFLFGELQAHAIKIWPVEWSYGIAIQLELIGCPEEDCKPDYAMSGPLFVDDRSITASSELPGFESWNARLKPTSGHQKLSAWMPSSTDHMPWIEVDLGKNRIIYAITVTGDDNGNCVTQFQLVLGRGGQYVTYSEPYGMSYTFSSQTDIGQTVTLYLQFSVEARLVRLVLLQWQGKAALKFDVLACSAGCAAVPMIASLPNIQLTASDSQTYHTPDRSKLNTQSEGDQSDGWKPLQSDSVDACFIQADLGTIMQIKAVATQGSASEQSWVTSYYLAFSSDGYTFRRYGGSVISNTTTNVYNQSVVYQGNFDGSTVVKNELVRPVNARYVQLWPHGFQKAIAVRWEIYACSKHTASSPLGCYGDDNSDPDLPYEHFVDQYTSMWPEACLSYCYDKDYLYAGLENGNLCSCGNLYGMYGVADGCNVSCQYPYNNFICGGHNQNMIYSTGISANTYTCPTGWTSYRDSCYYLMYPASWGDAFIACQRVQANLVDILDKGENDLVASMIGDDSRREFSTTNIGQDVWIGLSDILSNLNFKWTSGAVVNFTNWGYHQPTVNPGLQQHSVIMISDGTWKNTFNEDIHPIMCETAKKPSSDSANDTHDQGCLPVWISLSDSGYVQISVLYPSLYSNTSFPPARTLTRTRYPLSPTLRSGATDKNLIGPDVQISACQEWKAGNVKCYRFYRQKSIWSNAQAFCTSQNSTLARADSSVENLALASALSQLDGSYWLDVHDGSSSGLYTHSTGKVDVVYANWARQKPDSSGNCVSIQTGPSAGEWKNEACQTTNRFVCELPRTGYFPTQVISPNTKLSCPSGWELHGTLCYQFNIVDSNSMLTWHEANDNCIQQGAALASFHSDTDYAAVVGKFSQNTENFWIGLNSLDSRSGFRWSDESVMNFVIWEDGQPRQPQSLSFCGEISLETQKMGLQVCSEKRNWMCSVQNGHNVTNITEEVIPQPENYGACHPLSGNWYKYKDYCYYVSIGDGDTDDALTWRESRAWCVSQGGDLASVASADENAFLRGRLNQGIPVEAAWIGLNELDRSRGYSWSDGTPLGTWQMNWNVNEPDDYNGFEGCVEILARNGRWNDVHCSTRQGFVCKQPAPGANITKPEPPKRHNGNCPPDFSRLGNKCYIVLGVNGELDRYSWTDARFDCQHMMGRVNRNYSTDLASITTQEENAFIITLLAEYKLAAWVGLRRLSGKLTWADNEDMGFEDWSKDEPDMAPGNDSCVYVYGSTSFVGMWSDVPCEEKKAFICQGFVDAAFPLIRIPPSSQCNVTDGFQQFGTSCYKVSNQTASWQEAKASCLQSQATLATIMDGFDWAKLYLLGSNISYGIWIGLNDLTLQGSYTWDSGFPVTFTRWAHHQPKDNGDCVYMDINGLFKNAPCTEVRSYVCRSDVKPPQQPPAEKSGFCSDQDFFLYGSTCYLLVHDAQLTYEMAGRECELRGATLASIIATSPTFNIADTEGIWIGLTDSDDEGFSWEDSSVLDYTNWAPGKPAWSADDAVEDGCVVMLGDGKWTNTDCENKNGFLCAVPATPYQNDLTLPPTIGTQMTTAPAVLPTSPSSLASIPTPSVGAATTSAGDTKPSRSAPTPTTSVSAHPTVTNLSESTTNYHKTPSSLHQNGSGGLTGGQTAGVVVGVLAAVFTCVIISIAAYRKRDWKSSFLRREASRVKNFENSLYAETRKDTLTRSDHLEEINIVAVDDDPRKFSVSYSVIHASDEFRCSGAHSSRKIRHTEAHSFDEIRDPKAHSAADSQAHALDNFGFSETQSSDKIQLEVEKSDEFDSSDFSFA